MTGSAPLLRPELAALSPYNAGLTPAAVASRPGVTRVAKLGSNENPAGPAPEVITAVREAAARIGAYPDPEGRDLIAALAAFHGFNPEYFTLGNGSEDLLAVLARAVLRPGDEVVTLFPSFPLHEDYALAMGAKVTRIGLTAAGEIDLPALLAAVSRPVRLVLFANPMNPAGLWLDAVGLRSVLAAVHPDAITCLDEAYHEYASAPGDGPDYASGAPWLATHPGALVILRTFSKAWGLAGLRIGYAMTNTAELKRGFDLAARHSIRISWRRSRRGPRWIIPARCTRPSASLCWNVIVWQRRSGHWGCGSWPRAAIFSLSIAGGLPVWLLRGCLIAASS